LHLADATVEKGGNDREEEDVAGREICPLAVIVSPQTPKKEEESSCL
jgi:hypothetical protein